MCAHKGQADALLYTYQKVRLMNAPTPLHQRHENASVDAISTRANHTPGLRRIPCQKSPSGFAIIATRAFMEDYLNEAWDDDLTIALARARSLTEKTKSLCDKLSTPIIVLLHDRGAAIFQPGKAPKRAIPDGEKSFRQYTDPVKCSMIASELERLFQKGVKIYDSVRITLRGQPSSEAATSV